MSNKKEQKSTESKPAAQNKLTILIEFWQFMRVRKKLWLAPIIIFLVLLGLLIVFAEGSAIAPFIYTIF